MNIWNGIGGYPEGASPMVATIGNYDGVHLGHQALLRLVVEDARRRGLPALLITFDPHPASVLAPERRPRLLQTRRQKLDRLQDTGLTDLLLLEFNEDGTGLVHAEGIVMPIIYATVGDLYTEMMFDYPTSPLVPATYYWDFDGEHLTMELWGVDYQSHRNFMYADNTWTPIEDPQAVVVAATDFDAGDAISYGLTTQGYVPAAAVPPDAYTSDRDVRNRVAAVPISKGQPVTPDMLAPAE